MALSSRRNVQPHNTENISEDQIREYFHRLTWQVDRFDKDYGEDLFVRIFDEGAFTGNAFFVQLKGTSKLQSYLLKSGDFSYSVDTVNLDQWYRNPFPVIFVLWDIGQRLGYWLHIQPYVHKKLKANPNWLTDDGTHNIRIPASQLLQPGTHLSLSTLISREFQKVSLGLQLLERNELVMTSRRLAADFRDESDPSSETISVQHIQQLETTPARKIQDANADTADDWMEFASQYYDQRDYKRALSAIDKAKSLGASGPDFTVLRGSILAEYSISQGSQGGMPLYEAITLFEEAATGISYSPTIDYNIGNSLFALRKYVEAIRHYDAALTVQPPADLAAQIWKNRGTAFFHLGEHEEEFVSYQKALELNPLLWQAYSSWANTEGRLGNYQHAKELYIKAMDVYPELEEQYPEQVYFFALICWKLEDFETAYRYINHALSVKPDHRSSLLLKRHLLLSLWRKEQHYRSDALTFFQLWLQDKPDDMLVRRELYLLYRAQADQAGKQKASDLVNRVTMPASPSYGSLYYYSRMLIDEGKIPEAIDALEKAHQQQKAHNITHKLADLKRQTGEYSEAISLYKEILPDGELHALQDLAECFRSLGDYKTCVWCCVRAIYLDPSLDTWWNNLCYSLQALNEFVCAITVAGLRTDRMRSAAEEPTSPASEILASLLETIEIFFGKQFVESITAPLPPF